MTYQEFKNKYNGKYIDYDGHHGAQCWDLIQYYNVEVLNVPDTVFSGCGWVGNMVLWDWKYAELMKYFDEVSTIDMQPGDVCIWADPNNEKNCHVAIFDHYNPDDNNCYYFSQNPNPCKVMVVNMNGHHCFRRKKEKKKEKVDQWLNPGSHVQIPGTFEVVDINVKDNTAKVRIDGKDYWISSTPLLEVE